MARSARMKELFLRKRQGLFWKNPTYRTMTLAERGLWESLEQIGLEEGREFLELDFAMQALAVTGTPKSQVRRPLAKLLSREEPFVAKLELADGRTLLRLIGLRSFHPVPGLWRDERAEWEAWKAAHPNAGMRLSDQVDWSGGVDETDPGGGGATALSSQPLAGPGSSSAPGPKPRVDETRASDKLPPSRSPRAGEGHAPPAEAAKPTDQGWRGSAHAPDTLLSHSGHAPVTLPHRSVVTPCTARGGSGDVDVERDGRKTRRQAHGGPSHHHARATTATARLGPVAGLVGEWPAPGRDEGTARLVRIVEAGQPHRAYAFAHGVARHWRAGRVHLPWSCLLKRLDHGHEPAEEDVAAARAALAGPRRPREGPRSGPTQLVHALSEALQDISGGVKTADRNAKRRSEGVCGISREGGRHPPQERARKRGRTGPSGRSGAARVNAFCRKNAQSARSPPVTSHSA